MLEHAGWRAEWFLAVSLTTCVAFVVAGKSLFSSLANPWVLTFVFFWLFGVILGSAMAVVRQAEHLAVLLGEPYGTLVLTLSVTFIEVMSISAVMLHGQNNPSLVRDTLIAVIMIILNGMVGLSLLAGAWKHSEQHYNLQGANAYLGVIIPLAVLALVLPNYTTTTVGPSLSHPQEWALALLTIGLYGVFLGVQTGRHRGYFSEADVHEQHKEATTAPRSLPYHVALLTLYILPVVYLAEQLAHPVDYITETLRAPQALSGVVIAVLVATPEAIGATRAALANQMQRSGEHLLRIGAVDDRADRSSHADCQQSYRPSDYPGRGTRQHRAPGVDAGRQHSHLRQWTNQRDARAGSPCVVRHVFAVAGAGVKAAFPQIQEYFRCDEKPHPSKSSLDGHPTKGRFYRNYWLMFSFFSSRLISPWICDFAFSGAASFASFISFTASS